MSAFKYIVPALAIAGRVAAQCSAATTTIQNGGDASALASCRTFTGSIAIATGTTDSIALDGIEKISGSLIASNVTGMTSLSADSLETITDSFTLESLTILTSLSFPRLTNVDTIDWSVLNALQTLSFTTGVQTASSVSIVDTQLNSLDGINLQLVDTMYITNNNYLEEVNMQLGNITNALTIEANGRNVSATFPNLEWAFNITLRNVSSISIPSLASLNGSLGFYSNEFTTVNAANLTTVGGSLSFVSNTDLTNVSMPMLKSIGGGFQIANNTQFDEIAFPKLQTIRGALDFNGNFTSVSLPALSDVEGAFNLQSTANIDSVCSTFKPLSGSNNVIKGKYTCAGQLSHPGGQGTTPTSSGSSSTSSQSGAASGFYAQSASITGVMGVIAAIFGML